MRRSRRGACRYSRHIDQNGASGYFPLQHTQVKAAVHLKVQAYQVTDWGRTSNYVHWGLPETLILLSNSLGSNQQQDSWQPSAPQWNCHLGRNLNYPMPISSHLYGRSLSVGTSMAAYRMRAGVAPDRPRLDSRTHFVGELNNSILAVLGRHSISQLRRLMM